MTIGNRLLTDSKATAERQSAHAQDQWWGEEQWSLHYRATASETLSHKPSDGGVLRSHSRPVRPLRRMSIFFRDSATPKLQVTNYGRRGDDFRLFLASEDAGGVPRQLVDLLLWDGLVTTNRGNSAI